MLTGSEELIEQARVLSLHGLSRDAWKRYQQPGGWQYAVHAPGFKYNMTDLQASLGLCQLRRFAASQERRRSIVERYNRSFSQLGELELPVCRPGRQRTMPDGTLREDPLRSHNQPRRQGPVAPG